MVGILIVETILISCRHSLLLGTTIVAYAIFQTADNLKLKHTVILDIVAISAGFVLRSCAGAAATGIPSSAWFLLCTAMLTLFLGIEKRKAEMRMLQFKGGKTRRVLNHSTEISIEAAMDGLD